MLGSEPLHPQEEFDRLAAKGPWGALALCGVAVFIVVAIWFAFYFGVFLPRGHLQ